MLGDLLGSLDVIDFGTDVGNKIRFLDGKVLGIKFGAPVELRLDDYLDLIEAAMILIDLAWRIGK